MSPSYCESKTMVNSHFKRNICGMILVNDFHHPQLGKTEVHAGGNYLVHTGELTRWPTLTQTGVELYYDFQCNSWLSATQLFVDL